MAMDYEANGSSEADAAFGSVGPDMMTSAAGLARTGAIQLVPGPGNVVVLPEGATLDDITVQGRDLLIQLDDGRIYVIADGAIYVPEIVIDGVAIPALNFAALLIGNEPEPAAGGVRSSGGNFAESVDPIQAAFGLGNLLPYTELSFPQPQEREIIPAKPDRTPDVLIQDGGPASRDAIDSVSEVGLPGARVNGNLESPGSSTGNGADTTTGTIFITSPDGIAQITINGITITGTAGQQIITDRGVLTLGALAGNGIGYSYRLTDNTSGDSTSDVFTVAVTDPDGDLATARLTINIVDDMPIARNDADSVAAGTFGPESGNVRSGSGTTSGSSGADTPGADGATISGIRAGTSGGFEAVGTTISGQYGKLNLGADGTYTYMRNLNTPGGVSDVFTYQLTDGDGDASTATLTINIGDAFDRITFIPEIGDGTEVREPHLPARGTEPAGSQFDGNVEATSGTITFVSLDGVGSVAVAGVNINPGALPQQIFSDATGTLVITGYNYDPATGAGSFTYVYTLLDNTLNTSGSTVSFPVTVIDLDGDRADDTLNIRIIDDAPTAVADTDTIAGGSNAPATGNVITDAEGDGGADTRGADGATVTAIAGAAAGTVGGTTAGTYGVLTLGVDGSYSYARNSGSPGNVSDVFTYTITDADGDTSIATLTISIQDDRPVVGTNLTALLDDDALSGGNPGGTDDDINAQSLSGTLSGSGGDGALTWAFQNTNAPDGFTYTLNGTALEVRQGSTLVLTITLNSSTGAYVVTQNAPIMHAAGDNENNQPFTLVYTVTDIDGDSTSGTLGINVDDDTPLAANDTDAVTEDGPITATGNVLSGAGFDGNAAGGDSIGADGAAAGGAVTAITGGTIGAPLAGTYGSIALGATGGYTYTLNNALPAVQALDSGGTLTETFTYTITDSDGDLTTATLTITINGTNDVPVANPDTNWTVEDAAAAITGNVLNTVAHNGAPDAAPRGDAADTDVDVETLTVTTTGAINGLYGILTLNADGSYSYALYTQAQNPAAYALIQARDVGDLALNDVFSYTVTDGTAPVSSTLTIAVFGANDVPVVSPSTAIVSEEGLPGANADTFGSADTTNLAVVNGTIVASDVDVEPLTFTLGDPGAVLTADGTAVTWAGAGSGTLIGSAGLVEVIRITINSSGGYTVTLSQSVDHPGLNIEDNLTFAVPVAVSDGTAISNTTLTITIEDDSPTAVAPLAITVANSATAPTITQWLDADHNTANNYGADGGTVRFAPSLDGTSSGLTSNFVPILYDVVNDQTLVGMAGTLVIFTIVLNPASGEYSVDMNGRIDSLTVIDFNNGGYNFVGGNNSWAGFIPTGETVGSPIDNNSIDLLLTPEVGGLNSGTINATANTGGVSSGASVGSGEVFRVDFVTDLRGNPADGAGNYDTAANRDHLFDGHYTTNGSTALFKSSGGTIINIAAYDDPDGNNIVGDGGIDTIRTISIAYLGVKGSLITVTTTATNYTINGHVFTVQLMADGSVNVAGVAGESGSSLAGTVIATFTENGYNSIEYRWVSGDTFQIGDFGATTQNTNPVIFEVPVEVIDGDGDVSASSNLRITANYVPPIVLDLDGDGVEFVSRADGVTFDYAGDGTPESTAWAGRDDGLLAIDLNGDGIVNDGSEIVFGGNGLTDLQGLAISYDSNHDGVLDASDSAFAQFGVWQDANGNGVTDADEFRSLVEMGITSVDLTSDGASFIAADGDVVVYGTGSFTWANGISGTLADASFATSALDRLNARAGEMVATTAATTGMLAAIAAVAMPLAAGAHEAAAFGAGPDSGGATNFGLQSLTGNNIENLSLRATFFDVRSAHFGAKSDSGSLGHEQGQTTAELSMAIDHGTSNDNIADLAAGTNAAVAGASELFATPSNTMQAMDALLSMQAPVMSKVSAITTQDLPVIQEAFADTAASHAVDSIVEHFASGSLGEGGPLQSADNFALIGLLDNPVSGLSQSVPSPFEMAFLLDHQDAAAMA